MDVPYSSGAVRPPPPAHDRVFLAYADGDGHRLVAALIEAMQPRWDADGPTTRYLCDQ
jgi:hypothetical protein